MTVGNYATGNWNSNGFIYSKQWTGGDGKYTNPTPPRKLKWNSYSMTNRRDRIFGVPVIANGWHQVRCTRLNNTTFVENASGKYSSWCDNSTTPYWNNTIGLARFNTLWSSREETKLLAKLLYKFKGETSFNVGVSLAEVDKFASSTVGLIKNVSFGAVDLMTGQYSNFARRFGSGPVSPGRVRKLNLMDIPARFLEMQYCWLPAYIDLHSAAEAFEEISRGPRKKIFETSRTVNSQEADTSDYKFPPRKLEVTRRYTVEMFEELAFFRQMGLGNPASIAWERIPYSFVLDWFIPIGAYLELIGQVPFMKGRFMRSSSARQTVSGTPSGLIYPALYKKAVYSGDIQSMNFWYNREILASLSVPRPSFSVEGAVAGRRVNNAVALGSLIFNSAMQGYLSRAGKRRGPGVNPNLNTDRKLVEWSKSLLLI